MLTPELINAATEFVKTAGLLGVLVAIILSLFFKLWCPYYYYENAVKRAEAAEAESEEWRKQAFAEREAWKDAFHRRK